MKKNALIGMEMQGGKIVFIECHEKGNISYTGKLLLEHYNSEQQVKLLTGLGNIVCLEKNLKNVHCIYLWKNGEWYVSKNGNFVVY